MAVLLVLLLASVVINMTVGWSNAWGITDLTDEVFALILVLFLIAIIGRLTYGIVYGLLPHHHHGRRYWDEPWGREAEEVLDRRYARGEIRQGAISADEGGCSGRWSGPPTLGRPGPAKSFF